MKILVNIERLILDGLATQPGEAARIRQALERELAKTLSAYPAAQYHASSAPTPNAPAGLYHPDTVPNPQAPAGLYHAGAMPTPNAPPDLYHAGTAPTPNAPPDLYHAGAAPTPNAPPDLYHAGAAPTPNAPPDLYHGGAVPSLKAPTIRLTALERPETTGARIGQAIGQTLLGGRRPSTPSGKPGHG